jgi:hypothetical protein
METLFENTYIYIYMKNTVTNMTRELLLKVLKWGQVKDMTVTN